MSGIPKMAAQSDADARAMAALGGGPTDPNPDETKAQAAESIQGEADDEMNKAEGMKPPTKGGPGGQDKADGSQMSPGPMLNKGKGKDDEDDDEDDEEEEDEMERSEDASVAVGDDVLIKSLDDALAIARGASDEPDPDRRAELAEKLSKGEITADEATELQDLIKSMAPPDESDDEGDNFDFEKSFTEAALDDPDVQAGHTDGDFDVSGWLARQSAFVGGALDQIRGDISGQLSKSFGSLAKFNVALAKSNRALGQRVIEQGELIKSLTGRLETVENTPLPRKAAPTAAALKKSLPATDGSQDGVPARGEIVRGLVQLNKSSADGKAPCGMDITEATARFESTGNIHPAMLADVRKVIS
jgi:hypothetical protein